MKTFLAIIGTAFALMLTVGCSKKATDKTSPLFYIGPKNTPGVVSAGYTRSMEPVLYGGELIYVSPIAIKDVVPGMWVEFYWPSRQINVLHVCAANRVAGDGARYLLTRGIANWGRDVSPAAVDHTVTANDLIGAVSTVNNRPLPSPFISAPMP